MAYDKAKVPASLKIPLWGTPIRSIRARTSTPDRKAKYMLEKVPTEMPIYTAIPSLPYRRKNAFNLWVIPNFSVGGGLVGPGDGVEDWWDSGGIVE